MFLPRVSFVDHNRPVPVFLHAVYIINSGMQGGDGFTNLLLKYKFCLLCHASDVPKGNKLNKVTAKMKMINMANRYAILADLYLVTLVYVTKQLVLCNKEYFYIGCEQFLDN